MTNNYHNDDMVTHLLKNMPSSVKVSSIVVLIIVLALLILELIIAFDVCTVHHYMIL